MKIADRTQAHATLVTLLEGVYGDSGRADSVARTAVDLADLIGGVPQTVLARRTRRSRPTLSALCRSGVLRRDAQGHILALDAAFAELALRDSGSARNLERRVVEVADWFNELRDPLFVSALQRDARGEVRPTARPAVAPADREQRKRAFLEAQASAHGKLDPDSD